MTSTDEKFLLKRPSFSSQTLRVLPSKRKMEGPSCGCGARRSRSSSPSPDHYLASRHVPRVLTRGRSPVRGRSRSPVKGSLATRGRSRSRSPLRGRSRSPVRSKSPIRRITAGSPIRFSSRSPLRVGTARKYLPQ